MSTELMQVVEIELTDGRVGSFTGRVLVTVEDQLRGVRIRDIRFVEARALPPGCHFELVPVGATRPETAPESTGGTRAPEPEQAPPGARPRGRKRHRER